MRQALRVVSDYVMYLVLPRNLDRTSSSRPLNADSALVSQGT